MSQELPSIDPDASPEEQKEVILEASKQQKQASDEAQAELLDSLSEEHGTERVQTPVTLAGDVTGTVDVELNGELMDRFGVMEERLEELEDGERGLYRIGEAAEDVSQLLADMLVEPEYNKEFFYGVYEDTNLNAVGALLERVSEAIEDERERMAGAAEGFRSRPKDSK